LLRSKGNLEVEQLRVKLTYNALLVEVQPLTPRKSASGKSAADNSQRLQSGAGDASQELLAHGQSGHLDHLITSP
jgi:hypothetical protein